MLKWLVTKSPNTNTANNSVTDDPLATLSRSNKKNEPIYAVSRVNPIFEEESRSLGEETVEYVNDLKDQENSPDSPPTDRESVRSSGYGSKETDSVSYESEVQDSEGLNEENKTTVELNKKHNNFEFRSTGNVADIRRSFEILSTSELLLSKLNKDDDKVITANPDYVESIEVIPSPLRKIPELATEPEDEKTREKKPSWSRVSYLAQALQRQAERIHQRRERENVKERLRNRNSNNYKHQVLRFNPFVSVVAQDERYVTKISLSPFGRTSIQKVLQTNSNENFINDKNFRLECSSSEAQNTVSGFLSPVNRINKVDEQFLQPDSLVNEDTLKMMNSTEYEDKFRFDEKIKPINEISQATLPNFGKALYSNFQQNLYPNCEASSHYSLGNRGRNSRAKLNGINVVKDLWEKSGLKTNGRKLLVNSSPSMTDNKSLVLSNEAQASLDDLDNKNKNKYLFENSDNNENDGIYRTAIRPSSSSYSFACSSYEYFTDPEKGIDNLGYVNDIGNSTDSLCSSSQSKHSYPFQHNLTEFQKRVSYKLQADNNQTILPLERHPTDPKHDSNEVNIHKSKPYPGKAVKELELEGSLKYLERRGFQENISVSPSGPSHLNEKGEAMNLNGQRNKVLKWEQLGYRLKEDTFPSYFFRHPNSEAAIFAKNDGFRHDFTLDAKRSQRMKKRAAKTKRRRKCCVGFLVLFAFLTFIGIVIGLSWLSTGGQRLFGPL